MQLLLGEVHFHDRHIQAFMTNKHNAESTSDSRSSISQQLVGNLADCMYELRLTAIDTVELLHVGEFLLQLVGYTPRPDRTVRRLVCPDPP